MNLIGPFEGPEIALIRSERSAGEDQPSWRGWRDQHPELSQSGEKQLTTAHHLATKLLVLRVLFERGQVSYLAHKGLSFAPWSASPNCPTLTPLGLNPRLHTPASPVH